MASVSTIDNQLPLLQSDSENSLPSDDNNVKPFGQWLQMKSETEDDARPVQFKQHETREEDAMKAQKDQPQGTRLFAEEAPEKAKASSKLFKNEVAGSKLPGNDKAAPKSGEENVLRLKGHLKQGSISQAKAAEVTKSATEASKSGTTTLAGTGKVNNAADSVRTGNAKQVSKTPLGKVLEGAIEISRPPRKPDSTTQASPVRKGTEAMTQLKSNVKAIFNSLTPIKSAANQGASVVRQSSQGNTRSASMDKVKPIRLTTLPAAQPANRQGGKTTLQHLQARKSVQLDAGKLTAKHAQAEETLVIYRPNGKKPGAMLPDTPLTGKKGKSKLSKNVRAQHAAQIQPNRQQPASAEGFQAASRDVDFTQDNNLVQTMLNQSGQADSASSEGANADANQQNLLGKNQAGQHVSAEKSAGKTAQAFASWTSSWLKTLSERSGQMTRQDPNWKILEMKLDEGDGHMTIKVMREEEHVTISVQFTDNALREHAETQSSQILESLKEQYGKDVTFSFADHRESALDSSLRDQEARRRRLINKAVQPEQPVPGPRYNPLAPDQHMWIG